MQPTVFDHPRTDDRNATSTSCKIDDSLSMQQFANIVLEVSILLLESGAHCERIKRNVQRIAQNSRFEVEMLLSFTAISISITDMKTRESITGNKSVKHHGVHFGILANTSSLTWKVANGEISLDEFRNSLPQLKITPRYPLWLIRLFIGVACAALCILAGGDWKDASVVLVASSCGLIVRQELVKRQFNLMIAIICSAFVTTTIAGVDALYNLGKSPEAAIATSVLFLIPGVPLINAIIDLLEGYIPTGLARGALGGFILLCIAVGMSLSLALIGINNF